MPLHVHHAHHEWLIVEKPANVLVHPTRPDGKRTLWHELQENFPGEPLALVNRLDRETSGVILVSRTREAASILGKMMMKRAVSKKYFVLVHGNPPDEGTIDAPIDRIGKYRESIIHLKRGVIEGGYPSTTKYRSTETRRHKNGSEVSLLHVELLTGRIHQIRVHLSHIGFPVVGDKIYGPEEKCYLDFIEKGWTSELEKKLWIPRHALHACSMGFEWENEQVEIQSPLAADLQSFWDTLEIL